MPGHGDVVNRDFAAAQAADFRTVAERVGELHRAGVPADEAAAAAGDRWPWPAEGLDNAIARGYDQLGGTDDPQARLDDLG